MKLKIILSKTKGKLLKGYYNSKKQKKERLIKNILKNTQVSSNEIVFESEGDFSDNARALYEYMLKQKLNKKYKIIWIVDEPNNYKKEPNIEFISRKIKTKKEIQNFYEIIGKAKYLFFTHPFWYKKENKDQIIINLWHGIPLKAGGKDIHTTFDYITIPSEFSKKLFHKFVGSVESQYIITGSPRTDLMFEKSNCLQKITKINNNTKVIICMTTFKQSAYMKDSDIIYPFVLPFIENINELKILNNNLKKLNVKMIIKIHHLQKTDLLSKISLSNVLYIEDKDLNEKGIQLYELIGQTDALITDYSSIMFDYMLLDRPIGYFINDLEEYKEKRGFLVEDIDSYMIGKKMKSKEDFNDFLEEIINGKDQYKKEREKFAKKMHKYNDNQNCKRILKIFNIK